MSGSEYSGSIIYYSFSYFMQFKCSNKKSTAQLVSLQDSSVSLTAVVAC